MTLRDSAIAGALTSVWVEGGTIGELIDLLNHIVTSGGREEEGTLRLKIRN